MLISTIEHFIEVFGFPEYEKQIITEDLKRVVASEFLIDMMELHPQDEQVMMLRKSLDADNLEQTERILRGIFRTGESKEMLKSITSRVLNGWIETMQSSLAEEQKQKINLARQVMQEI